MSEELRACPHCERQGGRVHISKFSYWVECKICGYNTGYFFARAKAIAAWNRRAGE